NGFRLLRACSPVSGDTDANFTCVFRRGRVHALRQRENPSLALGVVVILKVLAKAEKCLCKFEPPQNELDVQKALEFFKNRRARTYVAFRKMCSKFRIRGGTSKIYKLVQCSPAASRFLRGSVRHARLPPLDLRFLLYGFSALYSGGKAGTGYHFF